MDRHLLVPPDRWCITRSEFFAFIEEVRLLWKLDKIPDGDRPNPSHSDPNHGPNLYQVNEHYVKPVTCAAGGMSYALMKHAEGLPCQVFLSHAWAEGLFELGDLVSRGWPRLQGLVNVYCCLLANPQNLNIEVLLNVPPEESPFAKAMKRATHVLVIPNDTVSIYTRLWCVYEAYLGTRWAKTVMMPMRPRPSVQCAAVMQTLLLPWSLGVLVGSALTAVLIHFRQTQKLVIILAMFVNVTLTALCFITSCMAKLGSASRRAWVKFAIVRTVHIGLTFTSAALACMWLSFPSPTGNSWESFLHYFIPVAVTLFNLLRVAQINQQQLESRELRRQAGNLHIQTLEDATCSHPLDEERIRLAISGREAEVDMAIRVLMEAGSYNECLRRRYEAGLSVKGLGNTDLVVKTFLVVILWALSIVDSIGFSQNSFVNCELHPFWLDVSIVFLITAAVTFPIVIWVLVRNGGPHRGAFASIICSRAASAALGLPLLIEIDCHLLRSIDLIMVDSPCPTQVSWWMVTGFRPLMAAMSALWSVLGLLFCFERSASQLFACSHCEEPESSDSEASSDASEATSLSQRAASFRSSG
ncbi:unnamed protein product [Symbiodinium natans]|uniref:Uncharacterized protein n=1 Tax=Symbiodinium natans TaxID=878477 RepID=A0A812P6R5_9DINO|nr:unnamed protein product [Symbiodinium natans]